MKNSKAWFFSTIGATIAGLACIAVPLALVFLGSTAIAFVPDWLDFVLVPVFVIFTGVSLYYWYRNTKTAES